MKASKHMSSFLGTYDLGADGKVILLALINAQLGTNYNSTQILFSEPYTSPNGSLKNTTVDFIPKAITGAYGTRKIQYDRINIADFGEIYLLDSLSINLNELLVNINSKLSIYLTSSDIINQMLINETGGKKATMQMSPSCFLFYGSTIVHTVPTTLGIPTLPIPTAPPITSAYWYSTDW